MVPRRAALCQRVHRSSVRIVLRAAFCACAVLLLALPANAQSVKSKGTTSQQFATRLTKPGGKMLVQADQMVYDYQRDIVAVVGHVQIYYDDAILEADRVTYSRKTDRLHAEGNVRYKAKDGNVFYGETMDVTRDFREGFVNALLVETPDKTRFAASTGERIGGNTTVFRSGVYTACEACKEDPKRPLLWQVKAVRIIHNETERIIYYQDATIEFFGIPMAYQIPFVVFAFTVPETILPPIAWDGLHLLTMVFFLIGPNSLCGTARLRARGTASAATRSRRWTRH